MKKSIKLVYKRLMALLSQFTLIVSFVGVIPIMIYLLYLISTNGQPIKEISCAVSIFVLVYLNKSLQGGSI